MTNLMLTDRSVDATTAARWNVVQYVVPKGGALEHAVALAAHAATNAEISSYALIHALPRVQDMATEDGLFVESFIASFTATSPEAEERLHAFPEKRAGRVKRPGAAE